MVSKPLLDYRIHGTNMHMDVMAEEREMFLGLREAIAGEGVKLPVTYLAKIKTTAQFAALFWRRAGRA